MQLISKYLHFLVTLNQWCSTPNCGPDTTHRDCGAPQGSRRWQEGGRFKCCSPDARPVGSIMVWITWPCVPELTSVQLDPGMQGQASTLDCTHGPTSHANLRWDLTFRVAPCYLSGPKTRRLVTVTLKHLFQIYYKFCWCDLRHEILALAAICC